MKAFVSFAVMSLGLVLASWPQDGGAQSDRDYVFTDEHGHLVIRFVGIPETGLESSQAYEVLNQEFSRMVHDRLHADLRFQDEPPDPDWAAKMEPQIEEHVEEAGPGFSEILVACRAASCRIIMEHEGHWSVREHQAMLGTVQDSLEAFVAAHRQHFEPGFLMTAYYQENETPHIKAFLRRSEDDVPPPSADR